MSRISYEFDGEDEIRWLRERKRERKKRERKKREEREAHFPQSLFGPLDGPETEKCVLRGSSIFWIKFNNLHQLLNLIFGTNA